jgi:hypothetical protein
MTLATFLERTQAYYGAKYPEGMRQDIAEYLSKYGELALGILYEETRNRFSARWNKLPDCAIWEEYWPIVREAMAGHFDAITDTGRMLEDKSEYVPREQVAAMLEGFAQKKWGI